MLRILFAACIKTPVPAKVVVTVKPPEAVILLVVPVVLLIVKLEKVVAFPFIDVVAAEKVYVPVPELNVPVLVKVPVLMVTGSLTVVLFHVPPLMFKLATVIRGVD